MPKKIFIVIALLVISMGIGLVARSIFSNQSAQSVNANEIISTAAFPDAHGQTQPLKQWQGKVVVLNFWATWCPPCLDEMPELSEINTSFHDKNVVVVGIATDDIGLVKEFVKDKHFSYPLLAADMAGSELASRLGNDQSALPYTVVIKPDGSVAATYFGRISTPELVTELNKII